MNYTGKPVPHKTEDEARQDARTRLGNSRLCILHSPHATNANGDYFIEAPDAMIRSWETEVFLGLGKDA